MTLSAPGKLAVSRNPRIRFPFLAGALCVAGEHGVFPAPAAAEASGTANQ